MNLDEAVIDRWLERGTKFLKTTARNPLVRGVLMARGLTDEELDRGLRLYTILLGYGSRGEARVATQEASVVLAANPMGTFPVASYGAERDESIGASELARHSDCAALIEAPLLEPRRRQIAIEFINWLTEWREIARQVVSLRAFRISLGLCVHQDCGEEVDDTDDAVESSVTLTQPSGPTALA